MPQAIFAYHLGMDAEQYAFFRIPKLLIPSRTFDGSPPTRSCCTASCWTA